MSELVHTILRQAYQQMQDIELGFDGHISEYDVVTNKAKVIIPVRGDDQNVYETGFLPIASGFSGTAIGFQYCFKGGATLEEPDKGEPVLVMIQNRDNGQMYIIPSGYNETMTPPGAGTEDGDEDGDPNGTNQLQPGEWIWKQYNNSDTAPTGSFIKFYQNGDAQAFVANDLNANVQNNCNVNVLQGDLNVQVLEGGAELAVHEGDIFVIADEGSINMFTFADDVNIQSEGEVNIQSNTGDVNIATDDPGTLFFIQAAGPLFLVGSDTIDINSTIGLTIEAPTVEVTSPVVTLGNVAGLPQPLMNEIAMIWTESHTHICSTPGSACSGPNVPPPGCLTIDTEAS